MTIYRPNPPAVLPTGFPTVDELIGGGLPRGLTVVSGPVPACAVFVYGAVSTTFANGGSAVFIDALRATSAAVDLDLAEDMGVPTDRLLTTRLAEPEQAARVAKMYADRVPLVVVGAADPHEPPSRLQSAGRIAAALGRIRTEESVLLWLEESSMTPKVAQAAVLALSFAGGLKRLTVTARAGRQTEAARLALYDEWVSQGNRDFLREKTAELFPSVGSGSGRLLSNSRPRPRLNRNAGYPRGTILQFDTAAEMFEMLGWTFVETAAQMASENDEDRLSGRLYAALEKEDRAKALRILSQNMDLAREASSFLQEESGGYFKVGNQWVGVPGR